MLRDYEGNYEEFLEKNEDEAEKMAVKEERVKEIEKACPIAICWRVWSVHAGNKIRKLGAVALCAAIHAVVTKDCSCIIITAAAPYLLGS